MQTDIHGTTGGVENWEEAATKVAEEVARAKGIDPIELDPLYEVVDPDALNELVTHATDVVRIDFEYEGRTVTVRGDGHVTVD